MENIKNELNSIKIRLLESFNEKPGLLAWTIGFSGIILVRTIIKLFVAKNKLSFSGPVIDYWHEFFFFLISILLLWFVLSFFLKKNPRFFSGIFFFGAWLIIFPPLIDMLKTGGAIFWSFYLIGTKQELWREFISFFGHLPSGIFYFGTRIVTFLSLALIAAVIYIQSKNIAKTILGWLVSYVLLFLMGAFPSVVAFFIYLFDPAKNISQLNAINIVQATGSIETIWGIGFDNLPYAMAYNLNFVFFPLLLALLAILFFFIDRGKFWAVLRNIRLPQTIYHFGLLFSGLGLGYLAYPENFHLNVFSALAVINLLLAVWLSWIASVIVNDIYDFKIDKISNPNRPLTKNIFQLREYSELGAVIFILALIGALTINFKMVALLLTYQFIAWAYSAKPYRLKRFPAIATLASSVASLLILFCGFFLFSGSQNLSGLSWRIILLIMITYTISLPIKDFKDIEGDKADGVWTVPVIFGEKKGRLIVAINIFVSYMLSVFFLNELSLFFWALLFGTATFLVVVNEKIKPQKLPSWVLGLLSIYALILVKIVFI